jgi:aryl-alcohol dehydrogenase-like predicted oxidoreductase
MTAPRQVPRFDDRLPLGPTGLMVSPFCLGMVRSEATISAAFDAGINFFFLTADMHWPLYETSRRGLATLFAARRSVRDEVVVAVASYPTQPEFCAIPFLEVLDAVSQLRRIDVAVMGGVYAADFDTRLPIYTQHRQARHAGISAIGASFHDRHAARAAVAVAAVDIAFVRYNSAHPGARIDLFPAVRQRRTTPVFNFSSTSGFVARRRMTALGLGRDYWHPHITDHYRFALTRPEIDGVLCALGEPSEVTTLARALAKGPLTEEEDRYLMDLSSLAEGRTRLASRGPTAPARYAARRRT